MSKSSDYNEIQILLISIKKLVESDFSDEMLLELKEQLAINISSLDINFLQTLDSSLQQQNKNLLKASERRHEWLNETMSIEEIRNELIKINYVLKPAILELKGKFPELVDNVSNFNSGYLNEDNLNRRTLGKIYSHWLDLFPSKLFGDFSILTSKNDLTTSSSTIEANDRRSIGFEQIRNFIDSPDVLKSFGTTIKSQGNKNESGSIYMPVIHCYHKKSGLNIMIRIPDLTFFTGFGLDQGQVFFKESFEFVSPRISEDRLIDDILEKLNEDEAKNYFSKFFLKSKDTFIKWFLERVSKKRKT